MLLGWSGAALAMFSFGCSVAVIVVSFFVVTCCHMLSLREAAPVVVIVVIETSCGSSSLMLHLWLVIAVTTACSRRHCLPKKHDMAGNPQTRHAGKPSILCLARPGDFRCCSPLGVL